MIQTGMKDAQIATKTLLQRFRNARGKKSVAEVVESAVPVHAGDVMEGAAAGANDSAAPMCSPASTVTPNNAENSGCDIQLELVPAVHVMEGAAASANNDSAAPASAECWFRSHCTVDQCL